MERCEESGEQDCSGPETHARAQSVERVPARQKLLRKAHPLKSDCPENGVIDRFPPPERKTFEGEIVHRPQDDQERSECSKPETDSLPELCSKGAPCREPVSAERPPFNPSHRARRGQNRRKHNPFSQEERGRREHLRRTNDEWCQAPQNQAKAECQYGKEQQAPAGADSARTNKN